jgi:hypothetical protein
MNNRPWTDAENATLRESYGVVSIAEIAAKLNRTVGAVKLHIHYLQLQPPRSRRKESKKRAPRGYIHCRRCGNALVPKEDGRLCPACITAALLGPGRSSGKPRTIADVNRMAHNRGVGYSDIQAMAAGAYTKEYGPVPDSEFLPVHVKIWED